MSSDTLLSILLRNARGLFSFRRSPCPALNDLDRKLRKFLDFDNGYFIEVGANDGYAQSNTYFLEKRRGWTGILIEPIPELYSACKKIRSKSEVINCALVAHSFKPSTITMHFAGLMSLTEFAFHSESERKEHLARGIDCQNLKRSYSIEVPARTLTSVLDNRAITSPQIDFLSLDVEGYEVDVLLGLDFEKYRPRYILVETRSPAETSDLLNSYYILQEQLTYHDYLFHSKIAL